MEREMENLKLVVNMLCLFARQQAVAMAHRERVRGERSGGGVSSGVEELQRNSISPARSKHFNGTKSNLEHSVPSVHSGQNLVVTVRCDEIDRESLLPRLDVEREYLSLLRVLLLL